ncbi:YybS family protein, partial [Klebsiella pneumoniae]|nr:YybS family protein [Klebsiella pneumoniae]
MGGGPARALASAVAVTVAVITAAAVGYGVTRGVTVEGQVAESLQSSITQAIQLYEKSGVSGADLDELREGMEQAAK